MLLQHPGGDGVIRELEPLRPMTMSILSERRTLHPYGMAGGEDGACGRNFLIRENVIVVNMGGRWLAGEEGRKNMEP
jgi:5-oxoprolinase (ATP-hydrolysing)